MRLRTLLMLLATASSLTAAPPARTGAGGWTLEKPDGQVVLKLLSQPVDYYAVGKESVS